MKYLGTISGEGVLQRDGEDIAAATYELEGYVQKVGSITGSGEIGLTAEALENVVDKTGLQLLTSNGRLLDLRFSNRTLRAGNHIHVDVSGELPSEAGWRD